MDKSWTDLSIFSKVCGLIKICWTINFQSSSNNKIFPSSIVCINSQSSIILVSIKLNYYLFIKCISLTSYQPWSLSDPYWLCCHIYELSVLRYNQCAVDNNLSCRSRVNIKFDCPITMYSNILSCVWKTIWRPLRCITPFSNKILSDTQVWINNWNDRRMNRFGNYNIRHCWRCWIDRLWW